MKKSNLESRVKKLEKKVDELTKILRGDDTYCNNNFNEFLSYIHQPRIKKYLDW